LNALFISKAKDGKIMDTFLAVIVVFGGLIAIGIIVSVYLYNSGAITRRRYLLRRHVNASEPVPPLEPDQEVIVEDDFVDV
jgi:hypothetical protein